MFQSKWNFSRILFGCGIALIFLLQINNSCLHAAVSNLTKIRCHLYEEGGSPVKVRIAMDFSGAPCKLDLLKSDDPLGDVPEGFVEDFVIAAAEAANTDAIGQASITYGNTKGTLSIKFIGNSIHVAVIKDLELQKSKFHYLEDVAYTDMNIQKRTGMPVPVKPPKVIAEIPLMKADTQISIPDTLTPVEETAASVEESIPDTGLTTYAGTTFAPDTVYIEKIIHDTVYLEKIVYIETGAKPNKLLSTTCEFYDHWWNEPYFKLTFRFTKHTEKVTFKKTSRQPKDTPENYNAQFVINQIDQNAPAVFDDMYVKYERCSDKIYIGQEGNKCYILALKGTTFKTTGIYYDEYNNLAFLRLYY